MRKNGFTLVETLVVLGVLTVVAALTLTLSMQSLNGYAVRSERDVVVSLLQKARSQSMTTIHKVAWGVCLDTVTAQYILFRDEYVAGSSSNERTDASSGVVVHSVPNTFLCDHGGLVFSLLAGTTSPVVLTVTQNGRSNTISINYEGTIDW